MQDSHAVGQEQARLVKAPEGECHIVTGGSLICLLGSRAGRDDDADEGKKGRREETLLRDSKGRGPGASRRACAVVPACHGCMGRDSVKTCIDGQPQQNEEGKTKWLAEDWRPETRSSKPHTPQALVDLPASPRPSFVPAHPLSCMQAFGSGLSQAHVQAAFSYLIASSPSNHPPSQPQTLSSLPRISTKNDLPPSVRRALRGPGLRSPRRGRCPRG